MIDLITIVFKEEIDYLRTQAESVSLYVPTINNIYVVVNDEDSVCDLIDTTWWGKYSGQVKVIPYSKWNYTTWVLGWENQQLLKLLAASESESKWSMVLDAKTWFIQQLDYTKLFDKYGRATVGFQRTVPVFQSSKEFVEQYYSITLNEVIGPAGVPFMFHTETVANMVAEFDDFINFFQTHVRYPHCITEFYLYSAYVLARYQVYEELYNKTQYYGCCNIADFDVPTFDEHFTRMQHPQMLTVSIHRRSYPIMSRAQLENWYQFLLSKKINTVSNWRWKWDSNSTLP
jgi:hypothetical protein